MGNILRTFVYMDISFGLCYIILLVRSKYKIEMQLGPHYDTCKRSEEQTFVSPAKLA